MRRVLFVHQGAEAYGSDRALLTLVTGLDRARCDPLVVVPEEGPLTGRLRAAGVEVRVAPVGRIARATLRTAALARLPRDLRRAVAALDRAVAGRAPDLVHTNTLAALGGALWARRHGIPHLWHVHEMVQRPRAARHGLAWLAASLSARVVCNSHATRAHLLASWPPLARRCEVVWNGVDRPPPDPAAARALRRKLGLDSGALLVALVGRLHRWKGQGLLVDAAERAARGGLTRAHYVLAGGPPPGQEHLLVALRRRIAASPVAPRVHLAGVLPDPWPLHDACDVAVVPSTDPEPFGLVAVEAMLAGKPVVAADHGGLREVVLHGETGLRVAPRDAEALAAALLRLAGDPPLRTRLGRGGLEVARARFSAARAVREVERIHEELVPGPGRA